MSITNIGGQVVYFRYRFPLDTDLLTNRLTGIIEPAIYEGMWVVKETNTSVRIQATPDTRSIMEISDGTSQTRIQFTSDIVLTVPEATPWIVVRWGFLESEIDVYAEVLAIAKASIQANDVVLGQVTFVSGDVNSVSLIGRTVPAIKTAIEIRDSFSVLAKSPASTVVTVTGGLIRTNEKYATVADGDSPAFTVSASFPRIDLLYVADTGTLTIATGVAAAVPAAPSYLNRLVIAEIYRPVGQAIVNDSDITVVKDYKFACVNILLGTAVASSPAGGTATSLAATAYLSAIITEIFTRLIDLSGVQNSAVLMRHISGAAISAYMKTVTVAADAAAARTVLDAPSNAALTAVNNSAVHITGSETVMGAKSFGNILRAAGGLKMEVRTSDPPAPEVGMIWMRSDL